MKRAVIRSKFLWSNEEQSKEWLQRRDVTTSRRHHVVTSPRRDVTTSRRHHVVTSPRRDVTKSGRRVNNAEVNNSAMSRRHHIATSPRRDVSSKICTSSFNVRTARKLGHREAYEQRHGFPEQSDTVFEETPGICTAFHVFDILGY